MSHVGIYQRRRTSCPRASTRLPGDRKTTGRRNTPHRGRGGRPRPGADAGGVRPLHPDSGLVATGQEGASPFPSISGSRLRDLRRGLCSDRCGRFAENRPLKSAPRYRPPGSDGRRARGAPAAAGSDQPAGVPGGRGCGPLPAYDPGGPDRSSSTDLGRCGGPYIRTNRTSSEARSPHP